MYRMVFLAWYEGVLDITCPTHPTCVSVANLCAVSGCGVVTGVDDPKAKRLDGG